jgi:hypothetical protein
MTKQLLLIVLIAATAPRALRAEPYTTVLGNKTVTSVSRPLTRSLGINRQELLEAARHSVPIIIVPSDPSSERKVK